MSAKKKPEPRVWDDETKRKAVADLESGRSAREIAAEIGAHSSTIYYWQKTRGKANESAQLELPEARPRKQKKRASTREANGKSQGPGSLSMAERDELIALRLEVVRLRKMIAVAL